MAEAQQRAAQPPELVQMAPLPIDVRGDVHTLVSQRRRPPITSQRQAIARPDCGRVGGDIARIVACA